MYNCVYIGGTSFSPARIHTVILGLLLCLSVFPQALFAEEEEVYFSSDYQQEIHDEQVLLLQGNVEVHFRDVIIFADEVRLNDEKDEFFGVGNVRLQSPDRDIFSDSIWYNYARDEFDMRNARGSLIVSGVSELVWFEAERLKGSLDDYKLINSKVSTCSPDERSEYHIEARSVKVLPENKVIFRNGYMFILNIPILWFPYWSYSLAEIPYSIDVGKDYRGIYVKTRYNYLSEELIAGVLILEYYSRKGWVIGGQHRYVLPRHGTGNVNTSFTYRTIRDDFEGTVVHANEYDISIQQSLLFGQRITGRMNFSTKSTFNPARGRDNSTSGGITANYRAPNSTTGIRFSGTERSGTSQSGNYSVNLDHTREIFGGINSTWKFNYKMTKQLIGTADQNLTARIEFRRQEDRWNWNAIVNTRFDPDGSRHLGDRNDSYTDRLPEINISFQPNAFPSKYRNWLGFQMANLSLVGGLYYIGPEKREVNGFYGRMDTRFTRTDDLGASHRLQSTLTYWQAIASTGDARFTYSSTVNWNWTITKKIKWTMTWDRSDEEGRIPLSGLDRSGSPNNRLRWRLQYQNGRLYSINLDTNYILNERFQGAPGEYFSIKRLQRLNFSFRYTPNRSSTFTLSTNFDFQTGKLRPFQTKYSMTDHRSYRLSTNLNLDLDGSVTTFTAQSEFIIGDDWDFEVNADFSPKATGGMIREIQVTHRLDCTFLAFQYRTANDEWFITWGVTGMPQARLGYSTTEDAFGPDWLNSWQGTGSGFSGGGMNF